MQGKSFFKNKYDELKEKKDSLFKQGADVLEEALKSTPDNVNIMTQLKNIYGAMGDNEIFGDIKKTLKRVFFFIII